MKAINEVELASEIAHMMAAAEMLREGLINNESEMWMNNDGTDIYTESAQNVFNHWYDIISSKIEDSAQNIKSVEGFVRAIGIEAQLLRQLLMKATREEIEELVEEKALVEGWKNDEID